MEEKDCLAESAKDAWFSTSNPFLVSNAAGEILFRNDASSVIVAPEAFLIPGEWIKDVQEASAKRERRLCCFNVGDRAYEVQISPLLESKRDFPALTICALDITKWQRVESLLRRERDLAIALSSAANLEEVLGTVLSHALRLRGFDCGGIYLLDREKGKMSLAVHQGLTREFTEAESVKVYNDQVPQYGRIMRGGVLYFLGPAAMVALPETLRLHVQREGLKTFVIVPMLFQDEIVATIHLGSHCEAQVDEITRVVLESMGANLGASIVRIRATEALSRSEERFRELVEAIPEVFWISEPGLTKVLYVSPSYEAVTGQSVENLYRSPLSWFEAIVPEDKPKVWNAIEEQRKNAESISLPEYRIARADGQVRWMHATGRYVKDADGNVKYVAGIFYDITRWKLAERTIAEANKAKSDFLANMSHEIRTPLASIVGFADMMLEEVCPETGQGKRESCKEYLGIIRSSSNSLLAIVNQLLDLSRIEARKTEVSFSEFDLHELLASLVGTFALRAQEKRISLGLKSPGPLSVTSDRQKVQQVIGNLLDNALKFTPEHGQIELGVVVRPERIDVEIKDNGIGIKREELSRIFSPFTQLQSYGKGIGLGLTISKNLAELIGGDIKVESEVGKGSTFTFWFPFQQVASHDVKNDEPAKLLASRLAGRVLLAEDNNHNQKLFGTFLKRVGLDVDVVSDGKQVLQKLGSGDKEYSLILMDIKMPTLDGHETLKRVRERYGNGLPVIALTAQAMVGDREKCLQAGFHDYFEKTGSLKDLLSLLSKYCEVKA